MWEIVSLCCSAYRIVEVSCTAVHVRIKNDKARPGDVQALSASSGAVSIGNCTAWCSFWLFLILDCVSRNFLIDIRSYICKHQNWPSGSVCTWRPARPRCRSVPLCPYRSSLVLLMDFVSSFVIKKRRIGIINTDTRMFYLSASPRVFSRHCAYKPLCYVNPWIFFSKVLRHEHMEHRQPLRLPR